MPESWFQPPIQLRIAQLPVVKTGPSQASSQPARRTVRADVLQSIGRRRRVPTPPVADAAPPRSIAQTRRCGAPGPLQSLPEASENARLTVQCNRRQKGPVSSTTAVRLGSPNSCSDSGAPGAGTCSPGSAAFRAGPDVPAAHSAAQNSPGTTAAVTSRGTGWSSSTSFSNGRSW